MIICLEDLQQRVGVFKSFTGLEVKEFEELCLDLLPRYVQAQRQRLERPDRQRAVGGGRGLEMAPAEQFLLSVIWLRLYPSQEVLGYLFGISDTSVGRTVARILPLLEASGRDTMRMPDPGRKRRRSLAEVLAEVPELAVIIDSFEQRVQRPKADKTGKTDKTGKAKDPYYSGKKKQHTLKSQVATNRRDGTFVEVSHSVPGPTADLELLRQSGLLERMPESVWALGDLAYLGMDKERSQGCAATPRRKPRGQEPEPQDVAYNRAFARERVGVEHSIGRLRRYECLTAMDRHHRQGHVSRVVAVAGLVNRQIRHRLPCAA